MSKTLNKNIKEKYECVFLLHAVGDTIGFKNSDWEFNYGKNATFETVLEFIFEFIDLGGINGINLKDWIISDDTLYHIAMGDTMLAYDESKHYNKKTKKHTEKFILSAKLNLIDMHNKMFDEKEKDGFYRFPGMLTTKAIQEMTETHDMRDEGYNPNAGGNGVAMRSLCIGLAFYKKKDLEKLIETTITLGKLTHNSPIGFLAGFTSAFFISLAIQEVDLTSWPMLLLELLKSQEIKKYIDTENFNEFLDYIEYINKWEIYVDTRFVDNRPLKTRSSSNMIFRIKYYYENFVKGTKTTIIGSAGHCAMIMAYDALLDCDGKWEKIVFYSILHPGDSDTVGAIACGLYGAVYGYGDVPANMFKYLEEKKSLKEISNLMFEKFYH
jgi:ADP-ribosylglycohydrolase